MNSKKQFLKKSRLYLITNENIARASMSLKAGVNLVQLRIKEKEDSFFLKKALDLRKITQKFKKILIINDRVDIALLSNADGVHLGQSDLPLNMARRILGKKRIIGVSTHSIKEAKEAYKFGADYIGIGPAFASITKSNYKPLPIDIIKKIIKVTDLPYFVIGGINLKNISMLLKNRINRIAVFSSIIKSNNPYYQTKKFIENLGN